MIESRSTSFWSAMFGDFFVVWRKVEAKVSLIYASND